MSTTPLKTPPQVRLNGLTLAQTQTNVQEVFLRVFQDLNVIQGLLTALSSGLTGARWTDPYDSQFWIEWTQNPPSLHVVYHGEEIAAWLPPP